MDLGSFLEILPHYLAMLVLSLLAVGAVRALAGRAVLVAELVIVLTVVFLYPFAVRRLGYEPGAWG